MRSAIIMSVQSIKIIILFILFLFFYRHCQTDKIKLFYSTFGEGLLSQLLQPRIICVYLYLLMNLFFENIQVSLLETQINHTS